MKDRVSEQSYLSTFQEIKKRVYEAQYKAFRDVNKQSISLYWDIGKMIVEKQRKEHWGSSVVEQLAKDLQAEFPGVKGFSTQNLWRMSEIYKKYVNNTILSSLMREIGWTQNISLLHKCRDQQAIEFYMRMTINRGWSVRTLEDRINNQEFEKWAINQTNFKDTLPRSLAVRGEVMLRDEYNLDFLEIADNAKERTIENKLMEHVDKFIKEMDGQLMFAGRQVKLNIGEEEFFIDLLFYHKKLRAYIIVELKIGKYKAEYAGKMALYLAGIEDTLVDKNYDNPTIGIILCQQKDRKVVETSLKVIARPVGVATYRTYEDNEKLPDDIGKYLILC